MCVFYSILSFGKKQNQLYLPIDEVHVYTLDKSFLGGVMYTSFDVNCNRVEHHYFNPVFLCSRLNFRWNFLEIMKTIHFLES